MPTFRYQAYTAEGRLVRGRREGLTAKEVRESLLSEGLYCRDLRTAGRGARSGFSGSLRGVFYRELGALLSAGLALDRALEILAERPELASGGDGIPAVRDRVREGAELSGALREMLPGLREDELAALSAGEASGRLATVTLELADFLEEESAMREQLRGALAYPAVIAVLALLGLGLLVGFLLPVYAKMLSSLQQELPLPTRLLLGVGAWVRRPELWTVLLLLAFGGFWWWRSKRLRQEEWLGHRRFRLPLLGFPLASLARARFARTLAMLMEGGVALPRAIPIAGRATGSRWLAAACVRMADEVAQGRRVAEAVAAVPVLGEDLPGWIRAGEASGDLAGLLRHAARGHQRAWSRGTRRVLSWLEPLLIVAVGLMILGVALAVLLPMMRLNRGLGA